MSTLFAPLVVAAFALAAHSEPPAPSQPPAETPAVVASPPAPVDPDEPPPPIAPSVPVVETPPAPDSRVIGVDTLTDCKTLLLDVNESVDGTPPSREQRDARLDVAEKCFRSRANEQSDPKEMARALAMADVVAAWRLRPVDALEGAASSSSELLPGTSPGAANTPGTGPGAADAVAAAPVSLSGLVESGHAEALVHGAVAGGTGGFLLAATLFSTTRQSEQDTLPWLVASPAVGAVAGAAGAWALLEVAEPTTGDIALASSAMWMGATQGFMLQLAVFDQNQEVSSTPLRFLTVFGGGAVGLASGVALSPFLDVTQGDAAVANSAAFWGGVMASYGLAYLGSSGTFTSTPQIVLALSAGSTLPYLAVLAAHPYLSIERWPSWLIEAGGAGGFLVSAAAIGVLGSQTGINGPIVVAVMGAGTLSGVVAGTAAAYVVSSQFPTGEVRPHVNGPSTTPTVSFAASALPDGQGNVVPALVAAGRF